MKVGDRIQFRIANGFDSVQYDAVVTGPEVTKSAPAGWPQATITTVPIAHVERTDGAVHTFTGTEIETSRIV